jgi:hypothetical protein
MNVRVSGTVCAVAALLMSLSALGTGRAAPASLPPPAGSLRALVAMMVKLVFVIVQENHTF